jgi:hypothetical protein
MASVSPFVARQHMTRKGMRKLGRHIAANLERTAPARIAKEKEKAQQKSAARVERGFIPGMVRGYPIPPSARH